MNESVRLNVIAPESVARKLAVIRQGEHPKLREHLADNPRIAEALMSLQYFSTRPGGLPALIETMIEELPHRFGTKSMRAAKSGDYTQETKLAVWREIPGKYLPSGLPSLGVHPDDLAESALLCGLRTAAFSADDDSGPRTWTTAAVANASKNPSSKEAKELGALLKSLSAAALKNVCHDAARRELPLFFHSICTEHGRAFLAKQIHGFGSEVWFCDEPIRVLLELVDRLALKVSERIALTAVTRKVFDSLDYAIQERASVRIHGNTRFGKTESARAWCDMRPGLARFVAVPPGNTLSDLLRRIAEALGMEFTYSTRPQNLKERIEYVIEHSGLFLVLDEGAFLLPANYSTTTPPARLNWLRSVIIDRGHPFAVLMTPQVFDGAARKFVKKTGYIMDQFLGKMHDTTKLPEELSRQEMIAVARVHLPELGSDYLAVIADAAIMSPNYLHAVESIAKRCRYLARKSGRSRISAGDIETAAGEIMERIEPAQVAAPGPVVEAPLMSHSGPKKGRSMTPARAEKFPPRSLRGTVPEIERAEEISASS